MFQLCQVACKSYKHFQGCSFYKSSLMPGWAFQWCGCIWVIPAQVDYLSPILLLGILIKTHNSPRWALVLPWVLYLEWAGGISPGNISYHTGMESLGGDVHVLSVLRPPVFWSTKVCSTFFTYSYRSEPHQDGAVLGSPINRSFLKLLLSGILQQWWGNAAKRGTFPWCGWTPVVCAKDE